MRLNTTQKEADATIWQWTIEVWHRAVLDFQYKHAFEAVVIILASVSYVLLLLTMPISFPLLGWNERRIARKRIAEWKATLGEEE